MAALPRETLYVLQDGITAELRARESRALQVLSEQKINMEQLSLQRDEVVSQNRQMVQVLEEACQMVPELAIPAEAPAEARIQRLAAGVREAREEMAKVQLELNLQIAELQLKAQPSTPPEVREQRARYYIRDGGDQQCSEGTAPKCWKSHLRSSPICRRTPTYSA
jgi:hypothetical protein